MYQASFFVSRRNVKLMMSILYETKKELKFYFLNLSSFLVPWNKFKFLARESEFYIIILKHGEEQVFLRI